MSDLLRNAIDAWHFPILGTMAVLVLFAIYLRGWTRLRRAAPRAPWNWRLTAFAGGLLALWLAIWSPLGAVDHALLTVHMIQHLVLMTVAAPLLLLGAPVMILLRGLGARLLLGPSDRLLRARPLRALADVATHPVTCWCAATLAVVAWHLPAAFELAMRSSSWHAFQRATFLMAGLLFWWPVVQPWPAAAKWPRWSMPLYLFLASLPCDALSAFFTFCGRPVYPAHLCGGALAADARLADQTGAGALMWFWVTIAYLVPAVWITIHLLMPAGEREQHAEKPRVRSLRLFQAAGNSSPRGVS